MCGTLKESRTSVRPLRGVCSTLVGLGDPAAPSASVLKYLVRSAGVTWSNSGVRPSYMSACDEEVEAVGGEELGQLEADAARGTGHDGERAVRGGFHGYRPTHWPGRPER